MPGQGADSRTDGSWSGGLTVTDRHTGAWKLLRGLEAYRAAFEAHAETPVFEEAAFPVRVQSEADLAAQELWRLEA